MKEKRKKRLVTDPEMTWQPSDTKMEWCQACKHFHPFYFKCEGGSNELESSDR